nr:HAMP domain-containing sensor histidine kinase [Geothrix sp.]
MAMPFLGLLVWSVMLIQATQQASKAFAHCSTWTLETARHLGVIEDVHEKATRLPYAAHPDVEAAALDAALDRLAESRRELGRNTLGEPDRYLTAVDKTLSDYLVQVQVVRKLAVEGPPIPSGPGKATLQLEALAAHAHLDHQHQTVLGSVQTLARYHKDMLALAIQSSQRNAGRLSMFAGVSLAIALGFGVAGGLALYQRHRSDLLARFSRTLVDTIPDGVVAWGSTGEVETLNPSMSELLGMPCLRHQNGLNIHLLLSQENLRRLEESTSGEIVRLNLFHATGALRAADVRVARIEHPNGPTHLAVMRDVSQQVEQDRRLLESQWQVQAGRRVTSIAKDLEYAMHPMLLAQDMLKPEEGASEARLEAWNTLHRTSEHAALLLRQFNRAVVGVEEAPDIRVFDLQVCLLELIESFHVDRGTMAGIEVDLLQGPSLVRGPVNLVRLSLELVIQRALDASAGQSPVRITSEQESEAIVIQISDRGYATSDKELRRIFDPVYWVPGSPLGDAFGLFNVAETLRNMGGEAAAIRTDLGWTVFTLRVPLEELP